MRFQKSPRAWDVCRVLFPVTVFFICTAAFAFSQLPTGTILGVAKDASGAVLPGVSVTVRNVDTDATRTTVTNEDGTYRLPALSVGHYDVTVELPGFNTVVQRGIELAVAQDAVVNVTLQPGTVTQQVEVVSDAALVNTTSSSLGGLVNETSVSELPLNGRNFMDLSLLQPGVTQQINLAPSAGTGGPRFSSNGAPIFSNNFLLDGAPMVNIFGGSPGSAAGTTLGIDGIREYKVITNTFSAEYGMTMGSQMVIVSKGGGNQFHGSVFEYLRNSVLDARNFFDTRVTSGGKRLPPFERNNFGGSLGGPIQKDKTFFFAVYEGLRQRLGITTINNTLPAGCHGALGSPITPGSCSLITSNVTVGSRSPAVVPLINLFPNPNLPNDQYAFHYNSPTNEDYMQLRIDRNISSKDTFFARYTYDNTVQTTARAYLLFLDPWKSRNQFATLSENHIFSSSLLSTARFSASRMGIVVDSVAQVSGPQYSFVAGQGLGGVTPGSGLTAFGPDSQSRAIESQNVFTASDDIFYTRGRHSLKLGTLMNYYQMHINPHASYPGTIVFANVANFLQGIQQSQTFAQPGSDSNHFYTYHTFGFYAQDDLRVAPRLNLNLGLRYEFMTTVGDRTGHGGTLRDITRGAAFTLGPPTTNPSLKNFSPRLGLAWDITGDGKTALRSGAALLYDIGNFGSALANEAASQPPFTVRLNPTFNAATASFTVPFTTAGAPVSTATALGWNIKQPEMFQYNLSIERQLPFSSVITFTYTGSRGYHLWRQDEGNPVADSAIVNGTQTRLAGVVTNGVCSATGIAAPPGRPDGSPCWNKVVTDTCANIVPSCRRNPNWVNLTLDSPIGRSWYNSFQAQLVKRFSRGVQFQSSYTWSKAMDTGQFQGVADGGQNRATLEDPTHPDLSKSLSIYDAAHNWRFNLIYHVPNPIRPDALLGKVLNGWWVGNIVSLQTGYPFLITQGNNRSGANVTGAAGADRPDYGRVAQTMTFGTGSNSSTVNFVPYDPKKVITGKPEQWFNPLMFVDAPLGYLGNVGRNVLRGPGLQNVDISLNKDTQAKFLGEQGAVQFRAEFFNILNHPNFAPPNGTVFNGGQTPCQTVPTYSCAVEAPVASAGKITSTKTASRQIQFALKLIF